MQKRIIVSEYNNDKYKAHLVLDLAQSRAFFGYTHDNLLRMHFLSNTCEIFRAFYIEFPKYILMLMYLREASGDTFLDVFMIVAKYYVEIYAC